jgi:hypothetical protein
MAWPFGTHAQQPAKILQVGFLYPGPQAAALLRMKAVLTGLEAAGLRAPDQVTLIPAVTGGDSAQPGSLAADLVARKVDLIFAQSGAAVRAATFSGFIASNAHPRWKRYRPK